MIPKIIHLCWLSGDAFPEEIVKCLKSFPIHLLDYEIFFWGKIPKDVSCLGKMKVTEMPFDLNSVLWTRQAFEAKKYAFAADYIRLYALYNYGGIYLDSDIIVYKSFNDLLHLPYFIGSDQIRAFEAAVIGAEKGCSWTKVMLDGYEGKSFIKDDGSLDTLPLPCRFHHVLVAAGYRFKQIHSIGIYQNNENRMYVFDGDFFNSRNAIEVRQTKKSYCAHNYANSWNWQSSKKKEIKDYLPKWLLRIIYMVGQKSWARKKYAWFQIPFES